uniref:Uncharacterized protein n=1 Tax=Oryza barthii TaxID=65489 RepID=A0A0D3FPA6_9ORYZ
MPPRPRAARGLSEAAGSPPPPPPPRSLGLPGRRPPRQRPQLPGTTPPPAAGQHQRRVQQRSGKANLELNFCACTAAHSLDASRAAVSIAAIWKTICHAFVCAGAPMRSRSWTHDGVLACNDRSLRTDGPVPSASADSDEFASSFLTTCSKKQ